MANKKQKKLLFICSLGQMRSPTAAELFQNSREFEATFAGLQSLSRPVTQELIDWADEIFVFDEIHDRHLTRLRENFDVQDKLVRLLHISNRDSPSDPELVKLLQDKLAAYLY